MKTISSVLLFALVGLFSFCYAQEGFYYQAVLRNPDGSPVKNQTINLELSIRDEAAVYYHETHELVTSENGLIHTTFGSGTLLSGSLASIDWSATLSLREHIMLDGVALISSEKPILKTPRSYIADKALQVNEQAIGNAQIADDAQIAFEKLSISRANIEGLGIIDTDTDTTYEVGDNGLTEKNFSAGLKSKLDGIEANADVTDTQNVVAALTAGTNITIAADGTISATGGSSGTTYSVGDGGLTEINFTASLKTKLDAIEAAADVTDTQNVVAALTAGTNISIGADGTISASDNDTTYSAGSGLSLTGTTFAIDNSVVTNNYLGTVTANAFVGDGSGLVDIQNLADASVTTAKIANASITGSKIADDTVTAAKISDASITTAKIADDAVTSTKLADGSVSAAKIADASITSGKIVDNAITSSKMDGGSFVSGSQVSTVTSLTPSGNGEVTHLITKGGSGDFPLMIMGQGELVGTNSYYITIPASYPLKSTSMIFTSVTGGTNGSPAGITTSLDLANNRFEVFALDAYGTTTTTFNFMVVNFDY